MTTYTQEDIERESDSHQFRAIIQLLQNKKNLIGYKDYNFLVKKEITTSLNWFKKVN